MKECIRCRVQKDLDTFHADKTRRDGKDPYCKDCKRARQGKMTWDARALASGVSHSFFSSYGPESSWLAGLLAADGSVSKDGRRWTLSQSGDVGKALVQTVADLIGYRLSIRRELTAGQDAYAITVTSPSMVKDLEEKYLITRNKTLTYEYPSELPESYLPYFVRGYVDGDGCVGWYPSSKGVPYVQISMVGTAEFISNVDSKMPIAGNKCRIARCKNLVDVRWNGKKAFEVGEYLYSSTEAPLSHKAYKFRHYATGNVLPLPDWMKRKLA